MAELSRVFVVARRHPVHVGATAYRVPQSGSVVCHNRISRLLHRRPHPDHTRDRLDRPRLEEQEEELGSKEELDSKELDSKESSKELGSLMSIL